MKLWSIVILGALISSLAQANGVAYQNPLMADLATMEISSQSAYKTIITTLTNLYDEKLVTYNNATRYQETRIQKKTDASGADRVMKYPCLIKAQKALYDALYKAEMETKKCFINGEMYAKRKLGSYQVYVDNLSQFVNNINNTCGIKSPKNVPVCVQEKLNFANTVSRNYIHKEEYESLVKRLPVAIEKKFNSCTDDVLTEFLRIATKIADDELDICFFDLSLYKFTKTYVKSNIPVTTQTNDIPCLKKLGNISEMTKLMVSSMEQTFNVKNKILEFLKNSLISDSRDKTLKGNNTNDSVLFPCLFDAEVDAQRVFHEAEKKIKKSQMNYIYALKTMNSLPNSLEKTLRQLLGNKSADCGNDFPKNPGACLEEKLNFSEQYVNSVIQPEHWSGLIMRDSDKSGHDHALYFESLSLAEVKASFQNCLLTGHYDHTLNYLLDDLSEN